MKKLELLHLKHSTVQFGWVIQSTALHTQKYIKQKQFFQGRTNQMNHTLNRVTLGLVAKMFRCSLSNCGADGGWVSRSSGSP